MIRIIKETTGVLAKRKIKKIMVNRIRRPLYFKLHFNSNHEKVNT